MEPGIDSTSFGKITVAGEEYDHDIWIDLDGEIHKRKKKLSREVYGTSHIIAEAEICQYISPGIEKLVIGSGQNGQVSLSEEAEKYLKDHGIAVQLARTPEAIQLWNKGKGRIIGLFHITC